MNEVQMTNLLSELLDCGVADISILEDTKYSWDEVVESAKELGDKITLGTLFTGIITIGLTNLTHAIENRIEELKELDNDLNEDELEELEELKTLNPNEDFETFFNYLDTHVFLVKNQETYEKYLENYTSKFEEDTGFNIQ